MLSRDFWRGVITGGIIGAALFAAYRRRQVKTPTQRVMNGARRVGREATAVWRKTKESAQRAARKAR